MNNNDWVLVPTRPSVDCELHTHHELALRMFAGVLLLHRIAHGKLQTKFRTKCNTSTSLVSNAQIPIWVPLSEYFVLTFLGAPCGAQASYFVITLRNVLIAIVFYCSGHQIVVQYHAAGIGVHLIRAALPMVQGVWRKVLGDAEVRSQRLQRTY